MGGIVIARRHIFQAETHRLQGGGIRASQIPLDVRQQGGRHTPGRQCRPAHNPGRAFPEAVVARRTAPALEHNQRRHVNRRPTAAHDSAHRLLHPAYPRLHASARHAARPDRLRANQRFPRSHARPLRHAEPRHRRPRIHRPVLPVARHKNPRHHRLENADPQALTKESDS